MSKKDVPKNQKKSYHRGANESNSAYMAFFRRLKKKYGYSFLLGKCITFGKKRVKRYRTIEGGL